MGGINSYSTTPGSNTTLNSMAVSDSTVPNTLDNLIRQLMADTRAFANDLGGKAVSSGTDTITLTTDTTLTAYADGTALAFIAGGTNTGAATLNVDSVGAKAIVKAGGAALAAGDITSGMICLVYYDASQGSGSWMLANPSLGALQPLDADLTSWAGVTRAAGFDTFAATPSSANLKSLVTDETGSGGALVFATGPTITDPVITGAILEDIFTITDGAAFEVDPSNGSIQIIVLGAARTPKATNFVAGKSVTLLVDDGTAYAITWTDATWGGSGVVWVGGSAPTLATSGYTVIEFWKVGTQVYGALVGSVA
jgi:hypothetical protein